MLGESSCHFAYFAMGDVNIFALIEDAEISGKLDLSGKVRTEVMPKEVFTLGDTLTHLNLDNKYVQWIV